MAHFSLAAFWPRSSWVRIVLGSAAVACGIGHSTVARALPPSTQATLTCAPASGVMVCVVQLESTLGSHITWAEATILSAPPFARPVRLRSTYEGAKTDPRLVLPLVLTGTGNGELSVLTRAVICADDGTSCPKSSQLLQTTLHVPR